MRVMFARHRRAGVEVLGEAPPLNGLLLPASAALGFAVISASITSEDHLLSFPASSAHSYFISYSNIQLHTSLQASVSEQLTPAL